MVPINSFAGGVIAGVLHTLLGPDHLSTIVTLSACQGADAFWFGVQWAGGHLSGMVVVGIVFTMLQLHTALAAVTFEQYEHMADYVIGCVMMMFGTFFLMRAGRYFDDEWSPKKATCSCHQHLAPDHAQDGESTPLTQAPSKGHGADHGHTLKGARDIGSVLVGFLQGIACPAGLVGLAFLKNYRHEPMQMLLFIAVFFATTTLSMGGLAMMYGILTQRCVSSRVLAKTIYYCSCGLSITLGFAWVILNATGQLDELLEPLHGDHDHHHGEHGHHEHAAMEADSSAKFLFLLAARR